MNTENYIDEKKEDTENAVEDENIENAEKTNEIDVESQCYS